MKNANTNQTPLPWNDLGGYYKQPYYEQAQYLIDKGLVSISKKESTAKKIYENQINQTDRSEAGI